MAWLLTHWRVIALAVLAAALVYLGDRVGSSRVQARWDRERTVQIERQAEAMRAAATETERRLQAQEAITREATQQAARNAADAAAAIDAARRLRGRLAAIVASSAASNPAAAAGCTTAGDPLGVLADVLGRADERAGILASYADAARTAGLACERAYDALKRPP